MGHAAPGGDRADRERASRDRAGGDRADRPRAGGEEARSPHPQGTTTGDIAALQGLIGNAKVAALLADQGRTPVQRNPGPRPDAVAVQRDGGSATGQRPAGTSTDLGSALAVPAMEKLRVTATQTSFLASAYSERGIRVIDRLRSKLEQTGHTYQSAYQQYASVVRAGRAEAQNQQGWVDIITGIGIGVAVGLIAGAVVPEGLALGWRVLAEAVGESAEAAVAGGVKGTHVTDVAGTDLEPGGLDPNLLKSAMWTRLSGLYRGVLGVQQHLGLLPVLLGNCEYVLGQYRLLDAGAAADMDRAAVTEMAVTLNRAASHLSGLNTALQSRLEALGRLDASTNAMEVPTQQNMERQIWVLWMSGLSDDASDILDLDAIEDRLAAIKVLGPGSLLGVDFGTWTSKADELAALAAARKQADTYRAQYQKLMQ